MEINAKRQSLQSFKISVVVLQCVCVLTLWKKQIRSFIRFSIRVKNKNTRTFLIHMEPEDNA